MTNISEIMQHNHRHCDQLYAAAEEAVANKDWPKAEQAWQAFANEFDAHITVKEEGQLFPALEAANAVLVQLGDALAAREQQQFLGLGETLMMLTQQHNMKEENILYPIMDQCIPEQAGELQ